MHNAEDWLGKIFSALGNCDEDFSGLGLILYHSPLSLPVLPLTRTESRLQLPTRNLQQSIKLLREVCQLKSAFHDGFHLVNASSLGITHVSQFFAPPIPEIVPKLISANPIGARFMSAWLGSLLPSVCVTAILSKVEGGIVFSQGEMRSIFSSD